MANEGMQQLIHMMNKLQDAVSQAGSTVFNIDLPQIVVVGGQSAGKSSVLENFVGKEFLPRGSGIVTRRPLIVQLFYHPSMEYAEFLHNSNKIYKDFEKVREEIEAETDRETGTNKNVSSKPINLRIYSPYVLDLTLVDLPGLTKVPVGDQPPDIDVQIRDMVWKFISKENSLILAVSPANQDIANSDALKIAREADPEGKRTIGVLTKLDLMDQGTDARDILENKVFLLQRGYIGIVNRSQKDIDEKKRIEEAVKTERDFFMNHRSYKHMADRMGTKYLQITLNKQLKFHIQERLPGLRAALKKHLMDLKKELTELNGILGESDKRGQEKYMIRLINMFIEDLRKRIIGQTDEIGLHDVQGGARINSAFYNEIADLLTMDLVPSDNELAHAIVNIHGYRTGLFTPGLAFDTVCNKLIENYKGPIITAVELITCIVTDVVDKSAQVLQRYPRLKNEVVFRVSTRLKEQEQETKNQCIRHINAEMAFHNVRHPDFDRDRPRSKLRSKEITLNSVEEIPEPQVKDICEGNLLLTVKGGLRNSHKDSWCKLSFNYFCWQKKEDTNDKRNMIPFTELRMQPKKSKSDSKNKNDYKAHKFILFRADGRSVFRDLKQLEFVCMDMTDLEKWTDAFKQVNVPVTLSKSCSMESLCQVDSNSTKNVYTSQATRMILEKGREKVEEIFQDPHMEKQVDELAGMVESYMEIVEKNIQDTTPKYIMLLLVQETLNYAICDLAGDIIGITNTETLMEVCAEEEKRRKELQSACNAIEEALKVIGSV